MERPKGFWAFPEDGSFVCCQQLTLTGAGEARTWLVSFQGSPNPETPCTPLSRELG